MAHKVTMETPQLISFGKELNNLTLISSPKILLSTVWILPTLINVLYQNNRILLPFVGSLGLVARPLRRTFDKPPAREMAVTGSLTLCAVDAQVGAHHKKLTTMRKWQPAFLLDDKLE